MQAARPLDDNTAQNNPLDGKAPVEWYIVSSRPGFWSGDLWYKIAAVNTCARQSQEFLDCLSDLIMTRSALAPVFDTLTLHQQLRVLQAKYAQPGVLKHPLLPQYSLTQVQAIEANNGVTFPAILRLYLLNISRQQAITDNRSCLISEQDCATGSTELHIEMGDRRNPLLVHLSGPLRGFVSRSIGDRNGEIRQSCEFLYRRLLQPMPEDFNCHTHQQKNLDHSHRQGPACVSSNSVHVFYECICIFSIGDQKRCLSCKCYPHLQEISSMQAVYV